MDGSLCLQSCLGIPRQAPDRICGEGAPLVLWPQEPELIFKESRVSTLQRESRKLGRGGRFVNSHCMQRPGKLRVRSGGREAGSL